MIHPMEKIPYTICFIKQGDRILLLNRNAPPNMGLWNGVGGKLDGDETPLDGVIREVREETGIQLRDPRFAGIVTWTSSHARYGGMYAFVAELPADYRYETPKNTSEGILEWKDLSWVLHPENKGVVENIPFYLPKMLKDDRIYEHQCLYDDQGNLTGYLARPLPEEFFPNGLLFLQQKKH